jgi:putative ABC transport system permease protein
MIRRFALKTIRTDKVKGICAIVAMLLTSILFSTLFTTIVGINKASEYSDIKKSGTVSQIVMKDCNSKTINATNKIKNNSMVESAGYRKYLADVISNKLKYNVEFSYEDEPYSYHSFQNLIAGHMPQDIKEVVMDEETIKALGVEKKIGEVVNLNLRIGKSQVNEDFILAGWFKQNNTVAIKTGQVIASKSYAAKWDSLYSKDGVYGQVSIDILLKSNKNLERQTKKILEQAGLNINNVDYSMNPAYTSSKSRLNFNNTAIVVFAILMIVLVGYLIINNIFHIAAVRDAKEYGQLKTLGMTQKQIGKYVRWQAYYLLIVAIPIGLILGLSIGKGLLPSILAHTNFENTATGVLMGFKEIGIILSLSVIFILITTMISIFGPIRTIGKISPIESTKLELKMHNKSHRTSDGGRLHKFAYYNVTRNKKNTGFLIVSISLPIILVSLSFTILDSFDMDKYLSKMIYSDYVVATSNYFKSDYLMDDGETASVSENMIKDIESSGLVKDGGIIFSSCNDDSITIGNEQDSRDDYWVNFYGLSEFNLRKDMIVEKKVDLKKFYNGDGIFEGVWVNDDGSVMQGSSNYDVGDKVTLQIQGDIQKEYQILGHLKIGEGIMYTGIFGESTTYELYTSSDAYKKLVKNPQIMAYTFDVKKGDEGKADDIIHKIITSYPGSDYKSKSTYIGEFDSLKNTVQIICIVLSVILSLIALLNLINVFITNIIVRKGEFATLRSIGMSRKQLTKMLLYEMMYYCGSAFVLSLIVSLLLSNVMIKNLFNDLSLFTYSQNIFVFVYILLTIGMIGTVTVLIEEKHMNKKNLAEQLKDV